ncbi:MAG: serine hydrolase domain-containing protein [Pseudomonadota bacterium]
MRCLFLFVISAALIAQAVSDTLADDTLGERIDAIRVEHAMVGVAYALIEDGAVRDVRALGTIEPDGRALATTDLLRLGSVSKNVTALLALELAAEGAVDLDQPAEPLLPTGWGENPWAASDPFTIRMLLEHTAGFPGSSYREYADASEPLSATDVLAGYGGKVRWPPGRFYSYSNMGIAAAAAALEAATGESFDALASRHIFDPLGLSTATFAWNESVASRPATFDDAGNRAHFWELSVRPAGSLAMSMADFAIYAAAHASAEVPSSTTPLSSDLIQMRRPQTSLAARAGYDLAYGLGTFGFLQADHVFWGHWGRIDGAQATFGILDGSTDGFALASNTSNRQGFAAIRQVLAEHVIKNASVVGETGNPSSATANELDLAGWYRPFTDDMELRAWITHALGLVRVSNASPNLTIASALLPIGEAELEPLGNGIFRALGAPVGTHVFTPLGEDLFLLGDQQNSYRKISALAAAGHVAGFWVAVFATFLGVGLLLFTSLQGLFRKRLGPGSYWRLLLGGAATGLLALQVLHVLWGMLAPIDTVASLGVVGAGSVTLFALSIGWPVLLLLGIWASVKTYRHMSALGRVAALTCIAGLSIAAGFLATQSWLPLMTWSA